ncbi:MAG TPA: DUF523 domain-containing protein [Deltaproteobacteria bacterium]|nr:DUF523 domain-containing protein [Deltaproteobacteria bacterium]
MSHKSSFEQVKGTVLVSACLLGIPCRYNAQSRPHLETIRGIDITPVPVCPEQLGGLPTPRPASYFIGGGGVEVISGTARLMNREGNDVTEHFINGAMHVCTIAGLLGVKYAIFKENSPSCGTHSIWLEDRLISGQGVAAAMLRQMGVVVVNEDGTV